MISWFHVAAKWLVLNTCPTFDSVTGNIVLDQIRTIDKSRILKTIGKLENTKAQHNVLDTLVDMFTF